MDYDNILLDKLLYYNSNNRRESQIEFAKIASQAASEKKNAILQGPTGIGKTRALLYATISHILSGKGRKSIYVVRTLGQFIQVINEFENCGLKELKQFQEQLRLGVAFGRKPMRDSICLESGKINNSEDCSNCKFKYNRSNFSKSGTCTREDYFNEIIVENCPYSYMKKHISDCNLIITTTGNINRREWIYSAVGGELVVSKSLVVIDEAHSYLDNLATNPVLNISAEKNGNKIIRQPEAEILIKEDAERIIKIITDDILYHYHKDKIKPYYILDEYDNIEFCLESIIKAINQVKEEISSLSQKHSRIQIDNRPIFIEKVKALSFLIEPLSSKWFNNIINLDNFRIILKELELVKTELSRTLRKNKDYLNQVESRISSSREHIDNHNKNFISICEEIDFSFSNLLQDLKSKKKEIEQKLKVIQTKIDNSYANHTFENIDNYKKIRYNLQRVQNAFDSIDYHISQIISNENAIDELGNLQMNVKNSISEIENELDHFSIYSSEIENKKAKLLEENKRVETIFKSYEKEAVSLHNVFRDLHDNYSSLKLNIESCIHGNEFNLTDEYVIRVCNASKFLIQYLSSFSNISSFEKFVENSMSFEDFKSNYETLKPILRQNSYAWFSSFVQLIEIISDYKNFPHQFWVDKRENTFQLYLLDLSKKINFFLGGFSSIILASGTIEPVHNTAKILGWDNVIAKSFDSPFSQDNYLSLGVLGVHSGIMGNDDRFGSEQYRILNEYIPKIASSINRNIGIFISSEAILPDLYQRLSENEFLRNNFYHLVLSERNKDIEDDYKILAKKSEIFEEKSLDANAKWPAILEKKHDKNIIVWLATAGKYSEGIDFKGKMLEAAILIGIPYPNQRDISLMLDSRIDYYETYFGENWRNLANELAYYVLPYRKLSQAAGRVHRKISDKGTIVFFDERLFGIKKDTNRFGKIRIRKNREIEKNKENLGIINQNMIQEIKIIDLNMNKKLSQFFYKRVNEIVGKNNIISENEMINRIKRFYGN